MTAYWECPECGKCFPTKVLRDGKLPPHAGYRNAEGHADPCKGAGMQTEHGDRVLAKKTERAS